MSSLHNDRPYRAVFENADPSGSRRGTTRPIFPRPDAARLATLRARLARLDGRAAPVGNADRQPVPLGIAAVDTILPGGGLVPGGLHEVIADDPGAGAGFAASVLARLAGGG